MKPQYRDISHIHKHSHTGDNSCLIFTASNAFHTTKRIRVLVIFSIFIGAVFTLIKWTIVALSQFIITYQLIAYSTSIKVFITNSIVTLLTSCYFLTPCVAYIFLTYNAYFFCRWHIHFSFLSYSILQSIT